jgi:hypothetical protein
MRLVAYIYRCVCGYEFRAEAGEHTTLMCNHGWAMAAVTDNPERGEADD